MLVLNREHVRASLPMDEAIGVMKGAFASLARGEATVPLRTHLSARHTAGVTLVMPARVEGASPSLAVKVVSVFDDNPERGIARIQAAVIVLEPETGSPVALLEGSSLTAIRTAATSGAATDLLARPDAEILAVFGAGVQARGHIEAMIAVRPIAEVRVFDPDPGRVEELIGEFERSRQFPVRVVSAQSPGDAVRGADVICTTTTSATPVFHDADVKPGAHINAVGAYTPRTREVSGPTVARAWVVVDDRAAAWEEAGDLILARGSGLIDKDHVKADLGSLVIDAGLRPESPDQVTLFKTVGLAVQDAAAAAAVLERAAHRGLGTVVPW